MGRLRDHRSRGDTTYCPDPDGCERLFHGALVSGLLIGDTCECCGRRITADVTTEITSRECADIVGVSPATWTSYVRARKPRHYPPPTPTRTVGRTPLWSEAAVREWQETRPGRGARLDLRG